MPRYFIEVFYKGTHYSGFQIQQNANSVQAEIEKALHVIYKEPISLTGSSRTDAGVHALQNYFHFDISTEIKDRSYQLNAILPHDIGVKRIFPVENDNHCRFDAIAREYNYYIYSYKNPFLQDRAFYYPYQLDIKLLQEAADEILKYEDFAAFSKKNTQVKTSICKISVSQWTFLEDGGLQYKVMGSRFLRGMVKALVGTMLRVGRNQISVKDFAAIIEKKDPSKADFSVPAHGLFLSKVFYKNF